MTVTFGFAVPGVLGAKVTEPVWFGLTKRVIVVGRTATEETRRTRHPASEPPLSIRTLKEEDEWIRTWLDIEGRQYSHRKHAYHSQTTLLWGVEKEYLYMLVLDTYSSEKRKLHTQRFLL